MSRVRTCADFAPSEKDLWCNPCREGRVEFCLDKDSHTTFSQRMVVQQEVDRLRTLHTKRDEAIAEAPWIIRWWLRLVGKQ